MKINDGPFPATGFQNARGHFYYRATRWGTVIQAWPRKRGKGRSGYRLYKEKEFGLAASMASRAMGLDLGTATQMVVGTTMVPRDFLMASIMGTAYQIIGEDGQEWPVARRVAGNAQLMLDQVTDTPGSMLFRSPIGWVQIVPGQPGQILTYRDPEEIGWEAPAAGGSGGGAIRICENPDQVASASGHSTKGAVFVPRDAITISAVWCCLHTPSPDDYQGRIIEISGVTATETVVEVFTGDTISPTAGGVFQWVRFNFSTPVALSAGSPYMLACSAKGLGDTFVNPIGWTSAKWAPAPSAGAWPAWARIAKESPAVGDTVGLGLTAGQGYASGLEQI